jgi:hypothetical protein
MTIQRSITLSDTADTEFAAVAEWKGLPIARLLSQYLEVIHQSDEFARLLERAQKSGLTLTGQESAGKQVDYGAEKD